MIEQILGKPWKAGAYGPQAYDCWATVWWVQKHLFAVDLPVFTDPPTDTAGVARVFRDVSVRDRLTELDEPEHGCIVELSHSIRPHHVGVWLDLDRGGILHCYGNCGVQFDRLATMKAAGWSTFRYYAIDA